MTRKEGENLSHRAGHMNLVVLFVTHRAARLVLVVEDESDTRLGDSGLTMLVDKLLKVVRPDLEKKRYRVSLNRAATTGESRCERK